jgi:peptidyl-dipeptidase Dcp
LLIRSPLNPFANPSPLPYEAPAFDAIREGDYEPAIRDGMRAQLEEIAAIVGQAEGPSFDNTVLALERTGQLLGRAARVFFAMAQANTTDGLQALKEKLAPELAAHDDAIHLDPRLFARIEVVHRQRDRLVPEARFLVERTRARFVHAGARLSEADKAALKALNIEESSLSAEFERKLLGANAAAALVLVDANELAGASEGELAAAALTARERGLPDRWVLPIQNTTQQPAQAWLTNRTTRERLFAASTSRTERGDDHDTRTIVQRLAELRARKAQLLGFASYAAYALHDQMAQTPERALSLLTDMVPPAVAKARGEAAKMEALLRADAGAAARLAPWDWQFYAERVREADYDFDDEQVRPYLELGRVLRDGVFFAAERLYGLTFHERTDLPTYHPDVRVYEVRDADGSGRALFYADHFQRDNKAGGAWMSCFVEPSTLLGARPVVYNVCNFTKPAPGQPALLGFDDVRTLFHEFGHALHAILSDVSPPSLAGTSVPRDFVEFPSQFNEHWATEPEVFANYARHHETGAPIPADLVGKIHRARKFNQGFATTEYLAAALLDMAWHTLPDGGARQDVAAFEAGALSRAGVDLPAIPPRYRTTYFAHVWGGGYAGSYYAYLWSEVLSHDAYAWFVEHGGMTRENGRRFREAILSRGHTSELAELYRAFRGRDPEIAPLLSHRGLDA